VESYTYLENNIIYLPVSKILPNPYQPRRSYNRQAIEELAASIKQYGVLQPVTVRYINNKIYELVNGERRLKAAQTAGFDTIPAMIINANDREAAAMGLAENLQRENLGYLEEAESMRVLKYGFKYSVNDISHIINKDKKDYFDGQKYYSTVLNYNSCLHSYVVAKQYCDKNEIQIFNATRGGKLTVFDRVDFEQLF